MSMPETSVHENHRPVFAQDYIRMPRKPRMIQSVPESTAKQELPYQQCNHSIFRLDTHLNLTYLCAVTFNNNDYGKRKSKLPGSI